MTIWIGALACVIALVFLICAICVAYEAIRDEEDEFIDLPELRFTSQGRVLRIEHYDESEG